MEDPWAVMVASAASVGVLHTVLGPDHYLPFVAVGSARGWSWRKLALVTATCGVLHVASSVVIAVVVGGLLGLGVSQVEGSFSIQGTVVGWLLLAMGLGYGVWGLWRSRHTHLQGRDPGKLTIFALAVIFLLGPCEAMIPLVMLPAVQGSVAGMAVTLGLFGVVTVVTMTGLVLLINAGLRLVPTERLQRAAHPLAGAVIALCGVAILIGL